MSTSAALTQRVERSARPYLERLKEVFASNDPLDVAAVKAANDALVRLKAITPGVVHVDTALTNLSIQYANQAYIGERLMPAVNVPNLAGLFYRFDKRTRMAYPDDELGPRGSPNEINENLTTDNFSCKTYGYKSYVDNQTIKNQDAPLDALADVVASLNEGITFRREKRIATVLTTAGNYAGNTVALGASVRWDVTGGDPVADIMTARSTLWAGRGQTRLVGFTTLNVMNVLARNAKIMSLFLTRQTGNAATDQAGYASSDMLARFFGLDEIVVAEARQDTANEGQAANYTRIWPDVFGVVRVAAAPSIRSAAFGYTFRNGQPYTDQWFDPSIGGFGGYYARVSVAEDHKIVAPDTGYLITTPIG